MFACQASALCFFYNATLHENARFLHRPCIAHTVLASLACACCFGELLWGAAFSSNFGKQLWE